MIAALDISRMAIAGANFSKVIMPREIVTRGAGRQLSFGQIY